MLVVLAVAVAVLVAMCAAVFLLSNAVFDKPVWDTVYDVSRDGRLVAYASRDRTALVFVLLADGRQVRKLEGFRYIDSVAFGQGNDVVYVIGTRGDVRHPSLFEVASNEVKLLYAGPSIGGISSVAASWDGRSLIFLEATKRQADLFGGSFASGWILKEYSIDGGEVKQLSRTGQFAVERAAFSPDDRFVALPGSAQVCLIDVRDGTTREIRVPEAYPGDSVFSPKGDVVYYIYAEHMQATPRLVRLDLSTGNALTVGQLPKGAASLRAALSPWRLFCVVDSVPWTPPILLEVNPETAETKEWLRLEDR